VELDQEAIKKLEINIEALGFRLTEARGRDRSIGKAR
jgi:hypothetical protein